MIKKYSLLVLQKALNQALSLDDSIPAKMSELEGKVLEIIIAPLQVSFFIRFEEQHMLLLDDYEEKPDTIIHSSPLGLIRLSFLPASKARSLFNDKIRISGDLELGQSVKKLFDDLDLDWEGHLAQFTGDVIAYQVGSLVRQGFAFKKRVAHSVRQNMSSYLQEELAIFPPSEEVHDFYADIDTLVSDVERLEAHINTLLRSHEIH